MNTPEQRLLYFQRLRREHPIEYADVRRRVAVAMERLYRQDTEVDDLFSAVKEKMQ